MGGGDQDQRRHDLPPHLGLEDGQRRRRRRLPDRPHADRPGAHHHLRPRRHHQRRSCPPGASSTWSSPSAATAMIDVYVDGTRDRRRLATRTSASTAARRPSCGSAPTRAAASASAPSSTARRCSPRRSAPTDRARWQSLAFVGRGQSRDAEVGGTVPQVLALSFAQPTRQPRHVRRRASPRTTRRRWPRRSRRARPTPTLSVHDPSRDRHRATWSRARYVMPQALQVQGRDRCVRAGGRRERTHAAAQLLRARRASTRSRSRSSSRSRPRTGCTRARTARRSRSRSRRRRRREN